MPRTGIADGLRAGSGGDFSLSLTARLFLGAPYRANRYYV